MPFSSVLGANSVIKPGVCTSTTRPTVPYEGQLIYETDTDTLAVYSGTEWVSVNPVNRDRNVVINGAMQVAQRGTSTASITASAYYTADRFSTANTTLGTWTQSIEADAPTGSGFRKSLKMLCTTADASPAAGDVLRIDQAIEGQNLQQFLKGTSSAKPFSLSFWVKSNVTGTYIVWLFDEDNTRSVSASYSISVSGTWEKKTITFPADTTGAFNNDNGRSLIMAFFLGAGSNLTSGTLATTWASYTAANAAVGQTNVAAATNNYWQITGVQLEAGSVATPFEFEDYGTTLAKCQRYFCRYDLSGSTNLLMTLAGATTYGVGALVHQVTMRAAPSAITSSNVQLTEFNGIFNCTSVDLAEQSPTSSRILGNTTGLTQYRPYVMRGDGNAAAHISLSAEL